MPNVPQLQSTNIKGENMKIRYGTTTLIIFLTAAFLTAQTSGKKPATPTSAVKQSASDFEFEVSINPLGLAGITVRRKTGLGLLTPVMLSSFASQSTRNSFAPPFVVRPDKDAKIVDVLAAINALRVSPKTDMRIEIEADLSIFVPRKTDPNAFPRPDPLTLVVNVDDRAGISLNGEPQGSFPDTSSLDRALKQIFQERENNGIVRPGTNAIETTVRIKLAKNMRFADLSNLARALRKAGSDDIGMWVDDTDNIAKM